MTRTDCSSPTALLLALLLLLAVAAGQEMPQENCGDDASSSPSVIDGCNIRLQEQHPCDFENGLTPATENDPRAVQFQYQSCNILNDQEDECTEPVIHFVYGNAVLVVDDMLVQRQDGDNICFLYDQNDGNAPTDDCQANCVSISDSIGTEMTLGTGEVSGLPNYGTVSRDRLVTILEDGTRSGGSMMATISRAPVLTSCALVGFLLRTI